MILDELRAAAQAAVDAWSEEAGISKALPVVFTVPPPHVETDVSIPTPLAAGKAAKCRPLDAAQAIADKIRAPGTAQSVPPGFINFSFSPEALAGNLAAILKAPQEHGREPGLKPRSILLEFVSANPTGPVHLASGRAATLGDSLARILRRRGHAVATENYVNDAGRQVELLGLSVKARYDKAAVPEDGYQGDYIKDLAAAAPPEAARWTPAEFSRFAVERMLAAHQADMRDFGTIFDLWFRESELHRRQAVENTLAKLKELGRVKDRDGAVWLAAADGDSADDKERVLVRSDGRPTYFLADIAYHQDKLDRGHRELIDIWGADHHGYCARMQDAMTALGRAKGTLKIILHQLVRLFRGQEAVKMSKRAGEFVTLRELFEDVGVDACRYFFAKHSPTAHMNFDIELAKKQTQENPVYYVQYVHARIRSIFREAPAKGVAPDQASANELRLLTHPSERALLVKLAWFPDVLRVCERDLSPHALPTYLGELATLYHAFYEQCKVLDPAQPELSRARLALCDGVAVVIKDGLGLLGVSAPDQM
ncbi:MAG: arginine--tRNA ligase [Elusimicrobiota bacterium]